MLTSSVFLETSIPNIPSITVLSFHLVCLRELRFEQPCTQDLRSRASQDTVQSEQRSLEKRGLIYRTGSFAKGTQEAHRSPRCSANLSICQAVRNVQGTRIAPRPPHRSRRALLTHRAPTLDGDEEPLFGPRVCTENSVRIDYVIESPNVSG